MIVADALSFVQTHGVVLESATGPVPSLAAAIAGRPVGGRWWSDARGRDIFALTRAVRACPDVLVCRVVGGKVSYVHRRLWPALLRAHDRFPRRNLARLYEKHTAAGRHVLVAVPFPDWSSAEDAAAASRLDVGTACAALGAWCQT
jgi:hypothetical protein